MINFDKIEMDGKPTKKAAKKPKATKKKAVTRARKSASKPKISLDKSTQVRNTCLVRVKNRVIDAVEKWLETIPNVQISSDENDAYVDLVHSLYEKLKLHIQEDQIQLLKVKQIELELRAVLTFVTAATYCALAKFKGFAKVFHSLSKSSVALVFGLSDGLDLSYLGQVSRPSWQTWDNVVDAINEAFKVERATIENFEKLHPLITDPDSEIVAVKLKITRQVQTLMEYLEEAQETDDFFKIDAKLQ